MSTCREEHCLAPGIPPKPCCTSTTLAFYLCRGFFECQTYLIKTPSLYVLCFTSNFIKLHCSKDAVYNEVEPFWETAYCQTPRPESNRKEGELITVYLTISNISSALCGSYIGLHFHQNRVWWIFTSLPYTKRSLTFHVLFLAIFS